jgi:hypothetical protein
LFPSKIQALSFLKLFQNLKEVTFYIRDFLNFFWWGWG